MSCLGDGNRAVFDRRKVLSFHPASTIVTLAVLTRSVERL